MITRADASQRNGPDKSSTVGILTAIAPAEFLLVQWKSGKTPRQCLGSNGAEVQTITGGENQNVHIRLLLAEIVKCDVK